MGVIGIDGDTLSKGTRFGDERYLKNLVDGLAPMDSKHEYVLYVSKAAAGEARALAQRFRADCRIRAAGPSPLWLKVPIVLPLMVKRDGCDLLHTQYFSPPFCPCPLVLTIHDVAFMRHPEFFSRAEARIFPRLVAFSARKASVVITDSEFSKEEIHQQFGVSHDRIRVVPLAVDPCFTVRSKRKAFDNVAEKYNIPFDRFLLFVGTMQPRKNVSSLLEAFARLRAEMDLPHGLVLVGEQKYGDYDVKEMIEGLGLAGKTVQTGFVPSEDLVDFYNAAELFVFPSLYEGFGFPPLEAMACGLPVAASQKGALREVLGEAAAFFDPLLPQSIGTAIRSLLENPERREMLRRAGFQRVKAYCWEATAGKTESIYEEVLAGRQG